jgi:carboxypeptidase C (cathepsin A)
MSCQFLSPALKERLEWHRYGCGHMAYVDEPTLLQMGSDLAAFYAKK